MNENELGVKATVLLKTIEALIDAGPEAWVKLRLQRIRKQLIGMELIPDSSSADGMFREGASL